MLWVKLWLFLHESSAASLHRIQGSSRSSFMTAAFSGSLIHLSEHPAGAPAEPKDYFGSSAQTHGAYDLLQPVGDSVHDLLGVVKQLG